MTMKWIDDSMKWKPLFFCWQYPCDLLVSSPYGKRKGPKTYKILLYAFWNHDELWKCNPSWLWINFSLSNKSSLVNYSKRKWADWASEGFWLGGKKTNDSYCFFNHFLGSCGKMECFEKWLVDNLQVRGIYLIYSFSAHIDQYCFCQWWKGAISDKIQTRKSKNH